MRLLYIIFLLNFIIACKGKKKSIYEQTDYVTNSRLERNIITFYKNNKAFDSIQIVNPTGDLYDGAGWAATKTPKYDIDVMVEFNIYGHLKLELIDSCYKAYLLDLAKNKNLIFPKKIAVLKHHKITRMFNNPSALAGMTIDGTTFYMSEIYMSNPLALKDALADLFITYLVRNKIPIKNKFLKPTATDEETI